MVGERVLPLVPQYKYLGVITHCGCEFVVVLLWLGVFFTGVE